MKTMNFKMTTRLIMAALWQVAAIALGRGTSEMTLAGYASGRIALHLLCASRDHRLGWHWRGVVREFNKT